jgi:DNA-binding SARP family transcriptional activator
MPDRGGAANHETGGRGAGFRLLGPFEVRTGGRRVEVMSPKHRVLLAVLLLHAGRPVPVERLAEAVWGEAQPDNPRRVVHVYVTRLRRLLALSGPGETIATCADGYRIDVRPEQVDLGRFRRCLEEAARAAGRGDLDAEEAGLAAALAQWRGEPLADVPSELLQREAAPQLHEQRLQAIERRVDIELGRGRRDELVGELVALTAQHPQREPLWARLMIALHRSGRRADALDAYHTVRRHLADELGIDPGEELQARYATVLAGSPGRDHDRPARAVALPPVPRQLPPDPPAFTGRVEERAQLDELLADRSGGDAPARTVVISGTAGVGKTALVTHWARRVADRFPDGQLWVDLRGLDPGRAVTAGRALERFLRALGVPDSRVPEDLDEAAALYRSLLDGRRMLIVLDDARSAAQVRPLLPGAPGCLLVVTSRSWLTGLIATEGAHPLVLDLLTFQEARQMLAARLGVDRIPAGPADVEEIVGICARLPLALAVVTARAATDPRFGLEDLKAEVRAARGGLVRTVSPGPTWREDPLPGRSTV